MLALAIVNALAGVRHDTASQLQAFAIDSIVRAHRSKAVATVAAQPRSPLSLSDPPKPAIPSAWHAVVNETVKSNGFSVPLSSTLLSSNNVLKRQYSSQGSKLPFAPLAFVGTPLEWLNTSSWVTINGTFIAITGIKYPQSTAPYNDLFSWLAYAKYDGDEALPDGRVVHRWSLKSEVPQVSLLLKVTGDSVPVVFEENVTITDASSGKKTAYEIVFAFDAGTWAPGAEVTEPWVGFDEGLFVHPPNCSDGEPIPRAINMTCSSDSIRPKAPSSHLQHIWPGQWRCSGGCLLRVRGPDHELVQAAGRGLSVDHQMDRHLYAAFWPVPQLQRLPLHVPRA